MRTPTAHRFRNRLAASLIATSLAALLASCGGGGGKDAGGPQTGDIAVDQTPPDAAVPIVLAAADSDDNIARLRGMGFEVVQVSGDPDVVDTADSIPQLFEVDPPDLPASSALSSADGRMRALSAGTARPMVVGGSFALPGQFPFAVQVWTSNGFCTGSIIAADWVKTAKHCTPTTTSGGSTGINIYIGSVVNGSSSTIIPVDYYVKLSNDISLFHLSTPTTVIPVAYNNDPAGDIIGPVTTMGFGRTSASGPIADLKFVDTTTIFRDSPINSPGYIILGEQGSNQTTCYGDSGGPTVRMTDQGFPLDIAATSATFYPYCTGLALMATTSFVASDIERVTGVPGMAFPSSNLPPVIPAVAPQETALGPTSVTIPATDPEGQPLVFSATGLPAGLSIGSSTGIVSGTTTAFSFSEPSIVKVTVTDSKTGASRSTTFPWRINTPGNADPVIQMLPSRTSQAGLADGFQVVATDPNGDNLQYSATGLPPGVGLSAAGAFSGTPNLAGQYQVNVRVVDGKGGMANTSFPWTVNNLPPVVHAIADQTSALGAPVSIPYVVSDPDGNSVTVTATGLPNGVKVVPGQSVISGTTLSSGTYIVKLTASDPYGGVSYKVFTWAVNSSFNRPPTMNQLSDMTSQPGIAVSIPIVAADPDGHKMTVAFKGLPPGVIYSAVSKTLTGIPNKGGVYVVDYSIYDAFGGKTMYPPITWTIPNNAPSITPPADVTLQPGAVVKLPFTTSDPDGHAVTVTGTGLPKGLVVNSVARQITGTMLQSGSFSVVLTATDKYGAKAIAPPVSITVPNQAPVIRSQLSPMTTVAGSAVSIPLDVYDPEGHPLVISASGLTVLPTPSSLPTGLVINSTTKTITGRPVRAGVYTVTLKVADRFGAYAVMDTFTWTITNQLPAIQPVANQSALVGVPYTLTIAGSDPEGLPVKYSVAGLPPGMKMSLLGVVSGTPTIAGNYATQFFATDPFGGKSLPMVVNFVVSTNPG